MKDAIQDPIDLLRLLQLADSALPIGGMSHSFGLESMVEFGYVSPENLEEFFEDWLKESGKIEAVFCAHGWRLGCAEKVNLNDFIGSNHRMGARKPSRESRHGSAAMARRFLDLVTRGFGQEWTSDISHAASLSGCELHYAPLFGFVAGKLGISNQTALAAFLHQSLGGLVSACQRLMPLGSTQAQAILFRLKPVIVDTAAEALNADLNASSFMPLLEAASMSHSRLMTRLFIS